MRHFQRAGGLVYTASLPIERDDTEVQVAPIDAVVIDGPLPDVKPGTKPGYFNIDGRTFYFSESDTVAEIEFSGWAILAIAAYRREHPPVDEAQMKAREVLEDLKRQSDILVQRVDEFGAAILEALRGTEGGAR